MHYFPVPLNNSRINSLACDFRISLCTLQIAQAFISLKLYSSISVFHTHKEEEGQHDNNLHHIPSPQIRNGAEKVFPKNSSAAVLKFYETPWE